MDSTAALTDGRLIPSSFRKPIVIYTNVEIPAGSIDVRSLLPTADEVKLLQIVRTHLERAVKSSEFKVNLDIEMFELCTLRNQKWNLNGTEILEKGLSVPAVIENKHELHTFWNDKK
ncbi:hypothetical protein GCK72_001553 [Caenorhabditis remanei]|uniref:Uncharacterized protein n=1 Tax=Caenorhabditis remanei TaxID=31234 RepID=A0A6A5HSN3_CAERE|nr:hypothetical protein GCK72_001553 [Caenorhabditis remanei]KAF1769736.1 hypothetical protein GCK72_001553 [Caenorhabditis remanei]